VFGDHGLAISFPGELDREGDLATLASRHGVGHHGLAEKSPGHDLAILFVPEIVPIHIAVGKPEPGMVRVIGLLPLDPFDEGMLASVVSPPGTHQGKEAGDASIAAVLGEELSIDQNFEVVSLLFDFDSGLQRQGCKSKEGNSKCAHDFEVTIQAGGPLRGKQECRLR